MVATHVGSLKKHFRSIHDVRVRGRTRHLLIDIIAIAIRAVIADCDDWLDIEIFAKKREKWFRRFLKLPNGVPFHDTVERVFARINPRAFERCCVHWLQEVAQAIGLGHLAIDGKTLRGSGNAELGPLHVVSAWATEAHLLLGQAAVASKSNEIMAIPKLLQLLDLQDPRSEVMGEPNDDWHVPHHARHDRGNGRRSPLFHRESEDERTQGCRRDARPLGN